MELLLARRGGNATVTQCHIGTRHLAAHTRSADIIVTVAGSGHGPGGIGPLLEGEIGLP